MVLSEDACPDCHLCCSSIQASLPTRILASCLCQCRLGLLKTSWLWRSPQRWSRSLGCLCPERLSMETCRDTESSTGPTCLMEVWTSTHVNIYITDRSMCVGFSVVLPVVMVHPPGEAVVFPYCNMLLRWRGCVTEYLSCHVCKGFLRFIRDNCGHLHLLSTMYLAHLFFMFMRHGYQV